MDISLLIGDPVSKELEQRIRDDHNKHNVIKAGDKKRTIILIGSTNDHPSYGFNPLLNKEDVSLDHFLFMTIRVYCGFYAKDSNFTNDALNHLYQLGGYLSSKEKKISITGYFEVLNFLQNKYNTLLRPELSPKLLMEANFGVIYDRLCAMHSYCKNNGLIN